MRIAFVPLAWATHYMPMVPLAWALRAAGHEVRVACQPGVSNAVVCSGMAVQPVGSGYDLMAALAEVSRRAAVPATPEAVRALGPEELQRLLAARYVPHVAAAEAMAADLVAFVRAWRPDLIVADPTVLAAPLAAAATGTPVVHHLFGADASRLAGCPTRGLPLERWPADLRTLFESFGAEVRPEYSARAIAAPRQRPNAALPERSRSRPQWSDRGQPGAITGWRRAEVGGNAGRLAGILSRSSRRCTTCRSGRGGRPARS
jgi:hypothetical protein